MIASIAKRKVPREKIFSYENISLKQFTAIRYHYHKKDYNIKGERSFGIIKKFIKDESLKSSLAVINRNIKINSE